MEQKKRGRPRKEDQDNLRKRHNVMLLPEIQEMAKIIGEGNVSKGLERAVKGFYGSNKNIRA